jgi:hypothetical protein
MQPGAIMQFAEPNDMHFPLAKRTAGGIALLDTDTAKDPNQEKHHEHYLRPSH